MVRNPGELKMMRALSLQTELMVVLPERGSERYNHRESKKATRGSEVRSLLFPGLHIRARFRLKGRDREW